MIVLTCQNGLSIYKSSNIFESSVSRELHCHKKMAVLKIVEQIAWLFDEPGKHRQAGSHSMQIRRRDGHTS